jgi:3-isopropylmalate/(R)-2-methylmalate dehydratase small subunit
MLGNRHKEFLDGLTILVTNKACSEVPTDFQSSKHQDQSTAKRIMNPFTNHTGLVVPLDRPNVDTDQIIPKQFLKRVERTGFGKFLFYDWRFRPDGQMDASFPLNEPRYGGASILIAGKNFGCGSSREHAPWALADFGFRAIVAPSFADIFANNCFKNGLLPVVLGDVQVAELMRRAREIEGYQVTVDLVDKTVSDGGGFAATFDIGDFQRYCLLEGLDDIGLALKHEAEITRYETSRPSWTHESRSERGKAPLPDRETPDLNDS